MNFSPLFFFAKRSRSASSAEGGRGRATAHGRGGHDLLNMHFFTLKNRKSMRGRLDTFAMVFFTFTFKSKRVGEQLAWLFFTFESRNSRTSALLRAGIDGSKAWI